MSDEEIKQILAIKWLEKYQGKFLGQFSFDDAPDFGKEIAQAQRDKDYKEMLGQVMNRLISDGIGGWYFRVSPREYEALQSQLEKEAKE